MATNKAIIASAEATTADKMSDKKKGIKEGSARDNKKDMRLGGGGKFAALKSQLAGEKGVTDPGALAAYIGRKKYGAKKFNSLAAKGK